VRKGNDNEERIESSGTDSARLAMRIKIKTRENTKTPVIIK